MPQNIGRQALCDRQDVKVPLFILLLLGLNRSIYEQGTHNAKKKLAAVGFEPTPPKRLVPKTSALDHSAKLPDAFYTGNKTWRIKGRLSFISSDRLEKTSNVNLTIIIGNKQPRMLKKYNTFSPI